MQSNSIISRILFDIVERVLPKCLHIPVMVNVNECKEHSEDIIGYKAKRFLESMEFDVISSMAKGERRCYVNRKAIRFLEYKSSRQGYTGIGVSVTHPVIDDGFLFEIESAGFYFEVVSERDSNDDEIGWRKVASGEELHSHNGIPSVLLAWR